MADVSSHPVYGMLNTPTPQYLGGRCPHAHHRRGRDQGLWRGPTRQPKQRADRHADRHDRRRLPHHRISSRRLIPPSPSSISPTSCKPPPKPRRCSTALSGRSCSSGIVGLCWGQWGFHPLTHTKKAVPRPGGIAGTRIRDQPGVIYAASYQQLGAPRTVIDVSEVYLALSQAAVDALEVPLISLILADAYSATMRLICQLATTIAAAALLIELAVVLISITGRAAVGYGPLWTDETWTDEAPRLALTAIAFIGCTAAYRGAHHTAFITHRFAANRAAIRRRRNRMAGADRLPRRGVAVRRTPASQLGQRHAEPRDQHRLDRPAGQHRPVADRAVRRRAAACRPRPTCRRHWWTPCPRSAPDDGRSWLDRS